MFSAILPEVLKLIEPKILSALCIKNQMFWHKIKLSSFLELSWISEIKIIFSKFKGIFWHNEEIFIYLIFLLREFSTRPACLPDEARKLTTFTHVLSLITIKIL